MKFKVIENEMPHFEEELNEFVSRNDIEVLDIKYSTSGIGSAPELGWEPANMHNALISYLKVGSE